jgi:hypothetical protein
VSSSNPDLVSSKDVSITGSGTNWNMVITPVPNASGEAWVGVSPQDGGSFSGVGFTVTVVALADRPVLSAAVAGERLRLNMTAKPGAAWSIERSNDAANWTLVGAATLDPPGEIAFEVPLDSPRPNYELFRARSW